MTMTKEAKILLVLVVALVLLVLLAARSAAQPESVAAGVASTGAVPAPAVTPGEINLVLAQVQKFIQACQTGDVLAALMVLINILMTLLKQPWFQAAFGKLVARSKDWRLSPRGKALLSVAIGLGAVALFAPASTVHRTIGKGLVAGFAAMGMYDFWTYVIKGQTHKDKAVREA